MTVSILPIMTTKLPKIVGISYLLIGVLLLILGFTHELFDLLYIIIVGSLLVTGAITVLLKNGWDLSLYLSRIMAGSLFVVSGLIKANDTIGFSYKLQDYFAPGALDWSAFISDEASLTIAVIIAIAEVVLGLAILFGGRMKVASIALLAMLAFFTWLTHYTASCNDEQHEVMSMNAELPVDEQIEFDKACVTDCGCFGDALKGSVVGRSLTPWESFKKDVALLVFAFIILFGAGNTKFNTAKDDLAILPISLIAIGAFSGGLFGWWFPLWFTIGSIGVYILIKQLMKAGALQEWVTAVAMAVITGIFTMYTLNYLPIKDFRPYRIGSDFYASVKGTPDVIDMIYIYNVDGVDQEFPMSQIEDSTIVAPWTIEGAEYVDRLDRVTEEGVPFSPMMQPGNMLPKELEPFIHVNDLGEFAVFQPDSAGDMWYPITADDMPYMRDSIDNSDVNYHEYISGNPGYTFIVCAYDISKTDVSGAERIKQLSDDAQAAGHLVVGLTKQFEGVEEFRHEHQWGFNFYQGDERIIKTMVRSNPGVLLIKAGIVVGKWHINNVPNYDEIANQFIE